MNDVPEFLAVDLGKSRCRVRLTGEGSPVLLDGLGAPGLAAPDGVAQAADAILTLLARLPRQAEAIGVGAAGALVAPERASALAEHLHEMTGARIAVTSDVVTAHAGVLGGSPGVLLIAGTGATALGVGPQDFRLVDGWGPELGDLGSGSWIGREALRATLRAGSGLTEGSGMCEAIAEHTSGPVAWLAADQATARRLATIAPLVLDFAEAGDAVASSIIAEAVMLLVSSAAAAGESGSGVALHGGLTESAYFRRALRTGLEAAGRSVVTPFGDALDGALRIVRDAHSLHERFVHRAG